jgi:hypothetical protein
MKLQVEETISYYHLYLYAWWKTHTLAWCYYTWNILVLIYYCAQEAQLEEHAEKLLVHIRVISYGLLLKNKGMWHTLSYTGISTFQ